MNKKRHLKNLSNKIVDFFTHTTYIENEIFEPVMEDPSEKQMKVIVEIRDYLKKPEEPPDITKGVSSHVTLKAHK
jgi:hypothetical protein